MIDLPTQLHWSPEAYANNPLDEGDLIWNNNPDVGDLFTWSNNPVDCQVLFATPYCPELDDLIMQNNPDQTNW